MRSSTQAMKEYASPEEFCSSGKLGAVMKMRLLHLGPQFF